MKKEVIKMAGRNGLSIMIIVLCLISFSFASDQLPVSVESRSAVLFEPVTETIVYEKNADEKLPPASLTKIMTLYLLFEALETGEVKTDDLVFVSKNAWQTGGSKMFIEVGSRVPLEEIIRGITVASGNDACVAIAEHLAGSVEAFVNMMNQKAMELGLQNTHFTNPHGLDDPDQFSTARDIAKLASFYIRRFPHSLKYHSLLEFTYNGITQYNRNRLLRRDVAVDGLKTGYVSRGGYHLIATAHKEGTRFIAVVMGAPKPVIRERDCAKLLSYGFKNFALLKPVSNSNPVINIRVLKGLTDTIGLVPEYQPAFLIKKTDIDKIEQKLEIPEKISAPLTKNTRIGSVSFFLDGKVLGTVDLITAQDVPKAPWYRYIFQSIQEVLSPSHLKSNISWITVAKYGIGALGLIILLGIIYSIYSRISRKKTRDYPSRIRYF